jgi:hypothetical protein
VQAVYTGKATATTLSDLCGATYDQLDQQYLEYIRSLYPTEK